MTFLWAVLLLWVGGIFGFLIAALMVMADED